MNGRPGRRWFPDSESLDILEKTPEMGYALENSAVRRAGMDITIEYCDE